MTTATPDFEVRYLTSKESPGLVCAQVFSEEIQTNAIALGGGIVRLFRNMQCSGWHKDRIVATEDLEAKIKLYGYRKVVGE